MCFFEGILCILCCAAALPSHLLVPAPHRAGRSAADYIAADYIHASPDIPSRARAQHSRSKSRDKCPLYFVAGGASTNRLHPPHSHVRTERCRLGFSRDPVGVEMSGLSGSRRNCLPSGGCYGRRAWRLQCPLLVHCTRCTGSPVYRPIHAMPGTVFGSERPLRSC
jgi:hypothetical protein